MNGLRAGLLVGLLFLALPVKAQQLDMSDLERGRQGTPKVAPSASAKQSTSETRNASSAYYLGKPLSASVSKVRYLPREIFGQWSLVGHLLRTDDPRTFSPTMSEIWLLEKHGDQLVIINPNTGGSASIAVEKVEGKTAFLSREIQVGRRQSIQENFTIRVSGDWLMGESVHKVRTLRNGQIVREIYGLYRIEAKRINSGSVQFRPEASDGPDIEIEEIRSRG